MATAPRLVRATTLDATPLTVAVYELPEVSVGLFVARVVARTAAGVRGAWMISAAVERGTGGGASLVGVAQDLMVAQTDVAAVTWDATMDAAGTEARVRVTGQASTTIDWAVLLLPMVNVP